MKFALLTLAALYAAAVAIMYFAQRSFLYFPDRERVTPASAGLPSVKEILIAAPDGETVIAWYGKAAQGKPTLLYFHGNGGSLAVRSERIRRYLDAGIGVFMMSYRGYSGSTGSPTEESNVADAKRAYEALRAEGAGAEEIILYGESLGSGVAAQVAAEKPVRGVILDSPFTSIVDRAAQLYPWLPVRLLLEDRYDTRRYLGRMRAPLLVLHGERDTIVPVEMGREAFTLASEPKELAIFPEAGHNDLYLNGAFERVNAWIDRLMARAAR